MKFISNSDSPNMFPFKDWDMKCHQLTEDEFQFLSEDAFSHMKNKSLAKILGIAYNPSPFTLRPGDILFIVHLTGGRLPENAETIPEDVVLEFYCYRIMESETPLIREEEIYMEEF
ncbi:hypothetical protein [uncultured Methanobrevibacter sp.]|uniref:hypothetical protein n=1 Tax=uncultured Methanobrevibacter sp. TaxID=253161 RepID=UPI0025D6FF99|nr:hypothetical protein [uncultured Methanobrevibacter sp.]